MVSMADEEGRLVLVGVDATYCVVDEVDTTASLSDSFLREAIEDAQTEANEEAAASDTENELDDPYLQEAIKNTAKNVIATTDLLLRGKIRLKDRKKCTHSKNHELETAEVEEDNGSIADENGETDEDVKPTALLGQSSSTLLRAALLSRPVSLREPNIPGPLNFCPTQDIEENPNIADAEGTADTEERGSNSAQANSNVKSKSKRQGSRRKPSAPKRVRLLKPNLSEPFSDESTSAAVQVFVAAEEEKKTNLCEEKKEEGVEEEGDKPKAKPKRLREKPYQCGICSRWFGCKSHVVEHMRTHTGEKPFQCTLCDKRFSQKSNIYQHMNTHTKERPFRCNDCGKDFMYRGSLYKHKRLHTGERPYTCGVCSRRFTHASQLFEHLRTHTNERPFKCGVCGRAFAHSGTMHRHQRNHFSQLKKVRKVNRSDVEGQEDMKADITLEGSKEVNLQEDINHNLESYVPPVDVAVTAEKTSVTGTARQNGEKSAQNSPPDSLTASADASKGEGDSIADRLNNNEISSAESGKNVSEPAEKAADQNGNEVKVSEGNGTSQSEEDKLTSDGSNQKSSPDLLGLSSVDTTNENTSSAPTSSTKQASNPPKKSSRRKSKTLDTNGTPTDKPKRTRIETPDRKVFSCDLCGHCFCHKRSVKRHKQAVHPEVIGEDGQVIPTADSEMAVSPATEDTEDEMESESKEVLRAQLTSVSLLKSLLTMTRNSYNNNDDNNNNNSEGHSEADLAALGARRLGEASANLQAIAQLCSQKETDGGGLTLPQALLDGSLSSGLVKSLLQGKGNSLSSAAENGLNVRIKSEPSSDDYVIESPASAVVDSGVGEEMEDMRTELNSGVALGSGNVAVKTEPLDSSECA
ncbi:uncharacterized protein [Littorina saxatilis]|uniref:C2H2-type domain-containing protein n=1 Tax=Littorina saxatilis TaxID=31220 RepID=A0AAN9AZR9_9CAEN